MVMTTLEKNYEFNDQHALHSSKLVIFAFLPIHFISLSNVVTVANVVVLCAL